MRIEDAVGKTDISDKLQAFSTGLNSGDFSGRAVTVMPGRTTRRGDRCSNHEHGMDTERDALGDRREVQVYSQLFTEQIMRTLKRI